MEETTLKDIAPTEQLPARTPLHEAAEQEQPGGQEPQRRPPAAQTLLDLVRDDFS